MKYPMFKQNKLMPIRAEITKDNWNSISEDYKSFLDGVPHVLLYVKNDKTAAGKSKKWTPVKII
tara:strand:- start:74 stop:265 length:192 start_codon:yes stop_codon:yes gene_type:complete